MSLARRLEPDPEPVGGLLETRAFKAQAHDVRDARFEACDDLEEPGPLVLDGDRPRTAIASISDPLQSLQYGGLVLEELDAEQD